MTGNQDRSRCIESLDYVRNLVKGQLDLVECPQHGYYSTTSSVCRRCSEQYECEWLFKTDPMANLQQKPDKTLFNALEFAVHYIGGLTVAADHNTGTCACESCTWLRDAEGILYGVKE